MSRVLSLPGLSAMFAGCATEGAVQYQTQTDTFAQAANNLVDILWVIDDSFSMSEEQETLKLGFDSFASRLDESGTDFQIGVITTSFDYTDPERGKLIGDPPFLTNGDDYQAGFASRATVGVDGSDKEKGLDAALFALYPTMVLPGGANEGFLREDGQLLVVIVSDEDDCSDNGALEGKSATSCYTESDELTPVSELVQDFRGLKASDDLVQIGAIVARDKGCPEYPGSRYAEAAALTGGLYGDICQSDWSSMLQDLGLNATGIHTRFQLSRAAQPDTLEVYVDETPIVADEVDGYTYDVDSWFIEVHGSAIPPRGSSLSATYTVDPGRREPEIQR